MPLLPLKLPMGLYKNGTPYTRKGRWEDGNLVRWHAGALRAIGGWLRRQDTTGADIATLIADADLEAVRDIFAWRDNSNSQNVVFGSNLGAYHMSEEGVITDITYAGYAALNSEKDASFQAGYGQNPYGTGAYGVANTLIGGDINPPDRWYFDNFGQVLLTGVVSNGTIYELDLGTLTLSAVTNAPSSVKDLCVTDQRQVFAVGTDGEPRRVRASDVEDRTDWTPTQSNQAIDRVLAGNGRLLRCLSVLKQVLILGETDAHVARYIGPPYIYSIELEATKCGPIAAQAVATTDRFAVWWGQRNFWLFDGSVQQIPCEVIDFLYDDINPLQVSKISSFTNSEFSEVWWLYQSAASVTGEVDSYVCWNYQNNHWITGRLDRTAGVDNGVPSTPIYASSDGFIYNHELDGVMPDGDVFIESGPIDLGNGDKNMAVRYLFSDTAGTGNVSYTLIGRQLPNDVEYSYGPYADQTTEPIPVRAMARSIKLRADIDDAAGEVGIVRLDYAPLGTGGR